MAEFSKSSATDAAGKNVEADQSRTGAGSKTGWETHDAFWRDNYTTRPYTTADRRYDYYQPAYKYGHEAAFLYGDRAWNEEIEHDLERGWDQARGESTSSWPEVREAVRDAYERARAA